MKEPAASPWAFLPEEWEHQVKEWGFPTYRGRQVFHWIHQRHESDPTKMGNLPGKLRTKLEEELVFPLRVKTQHDANDLTRKLLLTLPDERDVETVLIPMFRKGKEIEPFSDDDLALEELAKEAKEGQGKETPVTQCVSSQVGCAMGCGFCASGIAGLKRHMTDGEMISQLILGKKLVPEHTYLRNIVLMGMGEPLHNYPRVKRFLELATHQDGLGFSRRRVTLSTSGLVPQIDALGKDFEGQVQLAISLHAVRDDIRTKIMPINKKYPLKELVAALRRYPLPKRRRITLEYIMIDGVNDSLADADELVRLFKGIPVKVNLIPMNPVPESSFQPPSWDQIDKFQSRIWNQGVGVFMRRQRGDDVDAACGQLALYGESGERAKATRRGLPIAK